MNKTSDLDRITALPKLVEEALSRRQRIREEREGLRVSHERLRDEISKCAPNSKNSFGTSLPEQNGAVTAAVAQLRQSLAELVATREICAAAARTLNAARTAQTVALKAGKEAEAAVAQIEGRWFGIKFLQTLFDSSHTRKLAEAQQEVTRQKDALKTAQADIQEGENRSSVSESAFEAAKAAALAAMHQCSENTRSHYAVLVEADSRQWAATFASLPPFFRCDWSEGAWRSYNLTLICQ